MINQNTWRYPGLENEPLGGMSDVGRIVLDAQVFGLIPEDQQCGNWTYAEIQDLYDQVDKSWEPYAHLVSRLPTELQERHTRVYNAMIDRAKARGWDPELDHEN
jgi:hypothetical protein